jgi:UDP-N-acetylglucosamine acyltransferase
LENFIHDTAIIGNKVELGSNVKIGPYSIIEDNVQIGNNSNIKNFVTICENTQIGEDCEIFQNCSIGQIPQDLKFNGEKTRTIIGNRNKIRESVTINRGTESLGETRIGDNCLLMAYTHVGHDCVIGNNVVMANMATLGGHVNINDWVSLGGGVLVHQFCQIGTQVFIGGGFRVVQDVPPYILAAKEPLKYQGINSIGLKRRGCDQETRKEIKEIYKIIFGTNANFSQSIIEIKNKFKVSDHRNTILKFIENSKRGII